MLRLFCFSVMQTPGEICYYIKRDPGTERAAGHAPDSKKVTYLKYSCKMKIKTVAESWVAGTSYCSTRVALLKLISSIGNSLIQTDLNTLASKIFLIKIFTIFDWNYNEYTCLCSDYNLVSSQAPIDFLSSFFIMLSGIIFSMNIYWQLTSESIKLNCFGNFACNNSPDSWYPGRVVYNLVSIQATRTQ